MSDPFLAEIRIFPFNFAPYRWASCDGQILPISQNAALFSLLGTNFGGNGTSNFGLPNLQGAAVVCAGQGPGLSPYSVGDAGGSDTVTLLASEGASHTHALTATSANGNQTNAGGNQLAQGLGGSKQGSSASNIYSTKTTGLTAMNPQSISTYVGGNQPHNNMMPYLKMNFCIALQGIFPSRG